MPPQFYFYLNIRMNLRFSIYGQFQGNDHLIYNRSFFYLHKETERIVRHPLINGLPKATRIKRNRVVQNSGKQLSLTIIIIYEIYKISNEIIYILDILFSLQVDHYYPNASMLRSKMLASQTFLQTKMDFGQYWVSMFIINFHYSLCYNILN